jgi:nucleotide-binding universal stress UspA family protein
VTVVVGVDGSEGSRRALEWAVDEARRRGTTLRVVHAWSFPYAPASAGYVPLPEASLYDAAKKGAARVLDEELAAVDASGVEVEHVLVEGAAAETLVDASADAELLVVGSRGHGGFAGVLLGSVGTHAAHHAHVPVVIVPHRRRS